MRLRQLINNLLEEDLHRLTYSKPRFESKVRTVKDQMKDLSKDNDEFRYRANRSFYFHK